MSDVRVNPPDYDAKLAEEYASMSQMIRDTDHGLRYLVPDPAHPGARIVEEHVRARARSASLGGFYDKSLDYPIPLIGLQHFDFDLWGKGKQLSVFFGGVLLTTNYTDPALAGTRFDLGADLFAVAIPFGDVSYKNGAEVPGEKIKNLPAIFQVNIGHPIGPWLKASLGIFSKWDNYQRDSDTGARLRDARRHVHQRRRAAARRELLRIQRDRRTAPTGAARSGTSGGCPATPTTRRTRRTTGSTPSRSRRTSTSRGSGSCTSAWSGSTARTSTDSPSTSSDRSRAIRSTGTRAGASARRRRSSMNLSYGLNIEDIIRFEGFYDQAILNDRVSGFHNTYFSGAGLLASLNGPWSNSLIRGEVGVPVVSHGIHGVVVTVIDAQALLTRTRRRRTPACAIFVGMPEPIPFPTSVTPVKRALISVHDKTGIAELARELASRGVALVSTGGTAAHLKEAGLEVSLVEETTGFPEILGRPRQDAPPAHLRRRARRRFPRGPRARPPRGGDRAVRSRRREPLPVREDGGRRRAVPPRPSR